MELTNAEIKALLEADCERAYYNKVANEELAYETRDSADPNTPLFHENSARYYRTVESVYRYILGKIGRMEGSN